ncbi:MAG: prepilin peptidase [Opitutales bacterium]|nr:prepilin peptidase [Opitutales bacterium]MCH8540548.1 prepilin peptidase [Opitutales bacterium]
MLEDFFAFNELFPWFFPTLAFILGAITGSFLNVCILRIPLEKSIITPGSHCICGRAIPWYHNIPILTWVFLRGRCHCPERRPFSIRYPAIELLTAILFLSCWLLFPPGKALCGFVFIAILICATFIDFDHMIIPDRFTIGGFLLGVFLAFLFPSLHERESFVPLLASLQSGILAILGGLIGSALILWIGILGSMALKKEAMGFGDVKFIAAIGAFTGWQGAVFAIFGGALIGLLGVILWRAISLFRKTPAPEKAPESQQANEKNMPSEDDITEELPEGGMVSFGPMLAAGALVYFLFLDHWVDQYFAENAAFLFPG